MKLTGDAFEVRVACPQEVTSDSIKNYKSRMKKSIDDLDMKTYRAREEVFHKLAKEFEKLLKKKES